MHIPSILPDRDSHPEPELAVHRDEQHLYEPPLLARPSVVLAQQ